MAAINSVSNTGATAVNTTAAVVSSEVDEAQSRFMKLLVAQMQNQDPLNPMDNAQMTSQIAQLQTVSGINQLNATVQNLLSNYQSVQQFQSTGMLGRQVLLSGDGLTLDEGRASLYFDLPQSSDTTQVLVKDAAGDVVRTLDLGGQTAGIQEFAWDGKNDAGVQLPDGKFHFEVQALRNGVAFDAVELTSGVVQSVSMGTNGVRLDIPLLGSVSMTDVKQVR
jgi:flagellar basal-body rod modification protein FlgD